MRRSRTTTTHLVTVLVSAIGIVVGLAGHARSQETELPPMTFFPLEMRWEALLDAPLAVPAAFDQVHVYAALRNGTLTAFRLSDGEPVWSAAAALELPPAAGEGLVVVAADTTLAGLRATDGQPVWSTAVGATVTTPPLWQAGWVIAGLASNEMIALRGADGREIWRRSLAGAVDVQPSIGGRMLYAAIGDGRIAAIDLASGEPVWERSLGGSPREILAVDDLFVGSTDNFFYRLSRETGETLWRWRTGGDIIGRPAVDDRQVLFVSLDNVIRALHRRSGVQLWRRPLTGRPTAGPAIADELVVVTGVAPQIRAFYLETGRPAGTLTGSAEYAVPPRVFADAGDEAPRIVAATSDGRLMAMFAAQGPPTFSMSFPPPPILPEPERFPPADVLPRGSLPVVRLPPRQIPPADILPFEPLPDALTASGSDDTPSEGAAGSGRAVPTEPAEVSPRSIRDPAR